MEKFRIETVEDVKAFFEILHTKYELAFHPDDSFEDYVNIENGAPTFTNDEAIYLNEVMNQCFEVCEKNDVEIYDIGMQLLQAHLISRG
ncbi:hypothetical protein [Flavobacterium sp. UBA7682]|uniref:hypothetical protein n=1 Tax=Flavobacterium sp. UBA7682 TaxID=1946560 RepID=UPI0025BC4877|nr:hypothetical protein [Flavobacterium sp. UBA7682]